ncbi:zinc finger protein 239 [Musca domestica]|uniref:Zinc finger protein 239 n=1 Tax=Musca domestica TaxID=7370 RepID=A0A1I8M494_MUSDO|nr:zinc finger protein 239 [Musca domestica]
MATTEEYEETVPMNGMVSMYTCKRCNKIFPCKRDQLLHKKEVHSQTKSSYECKMCQKYFCNSGNLERHMKVHNDVRPFVCRICGKAFAQSVNLNRHYSVHNGERPYQCSFCTKSFTQQSNMQRHQLTHTGEKPFRCKRCGRYFSQRVNLKKHIMGHLNTKPYSCRICEKSFIQLGNFKKHLHSHVKEGMDIDMKATIEEAQAIAKQNLELADEQPVGFECAVCRSVFNNFTDFEMHEGECNENAQSALEQKFNPDQIHEVIVEETSEHVDDHMLPIETGASLGTYAPLKFSVSQLDTHEIIIETSR